MVIGRLMINRFGDEHPEMPGCREYDCVPVNPKPEKDQMQIKFSIETRYISGNATERVGWKYTLKWEDPASNGAHKVYNYDHSYGHATRGTAGEAAEKKAREIAPTLLPIETYEYTVQL